MDGLVQIPRRFALLPETSFLTVNDIDSLLSARLGLLASSSSSTQLLSTYTTNPLLGHSMMTTRPKHLYTLLLWRIWWNKALKSRLNNAAFLTRFSITHIFSGRGADAMLLPA
jgi:hypothetical protein